MKTENILKSTIKIDLNNDLINRLNSYIKTINIDENLPTHWHKRIIHNRNCIKIENNKVYITKQPLGFDNDYLSMFLPKHKYLNFFGKKLVIVKKIKKFILNVLGNYTSIGFDNLLWFKKNWPKNKSYFNFENIKERNFLEKWGVTKLADFWYFNEIYDVIKKNNHKVKKVIEIGPGTGGLLILIKKILNPKSIFVIDLEENIPFVFLSIIKNFPNSKILLPNEIKNNNLDSDLDFVFISPKLLEFIPKNSFDLAINTASFGEMRLETVKKYFLCLREAVAETNFFYCLNRVEKILDHNNEKIFNRFSEYPWDKNDINYKYEISEINRGKNTNNSFVKICKLSKKITNN